MNMKFSYKRFSQRRCSEFRSSGTRRFVGGWRVRDVSGCSRRPLKMMVLRSLKRSVTTYPTTRYHTSGTLTPNLNTNFQFTAWKSFIFSTETPACCCTQTVLQQVAQFAMCLCLRTGVFFKD